LCLKVADQRTSSIRRKGLQLVVGNFYPAILKSNARHQFLPSIRPLPRCEDRIDPPDERSQWFVISSVKAVASTQSTEHRVGTG
jgi:hypothetical protein